MAKKSVKIKEEYLDKFNDIKKSLELEFDYEVVEALIRNGYSMLFPYNSGDIKVRLVRDSNYTGFPITQDIKVNLSIAERLYKNYSLSAQCIINTGTIEGLLFLELYVTEDELKFIRDEMKFQECTLNNVTEFIIPNKLCASIVSHIEFIEHLGRVKQHISKENIMRCMLGEQSNIRN